MVTRKRAIIVATDAVGYSRLMEADEAGTLESLKTHRRSLEDLSASFHGRVVGMSGDSVLLEFAGAEDAVRYTLAAQQRIGEVNADLPEQRRMLFRMGVNSGDVIIDGDDLFGDGVNIAARLESLARPGGVCISDEVRQQLPDDLQADFDDQGERALKNISRPVNIWQWRCARDAPEHNAEATVDGRTRVLVQPFDSRGASGEQTHFAADLADDIGAVLSHLSAVVAVHGDDEAHDFTIGGSVRWAGDRVRVTAHLIDEDEGTRIWTEQFDRDVDDIFAVQDDVAEAIVGNARMIIKHQEAKRLEARDETTLSVPELLARAAGIFTGTSGRNAEGRRLLERATALEPDNSMAHAMLAMARARQCDESAKICPPETVAELDAEARLGIRYDAHSFFAHLSMAVIRHYFLRRPRDALASAEQALAINPHLVPAQVLVGALRGLMGDPSAGLDAIRHGIDLDRHNIQAERYFYELAYVSFAADDLPAAAEAAQRAVQRVAERPRNELLYAACLGLLDRTDEARPLIDMLLRDTPDLTAASAVAPPFVTPADEARYRDGLIRAGLPAG